MARDDVSNRAADVYDCFSRVMLNSSIVVIANGDASSTEQSKFGRFFENSGRRAGGA